LKPDVETKTKLFAKLNNAKARWCRRPIMYPANYPIAFLRIMAMLHKVAGAVLELDSNTFFTEVCNTIWVATLNALDSKPESSAREVRKQKHYALLVVRCEIERGTVGKACGTNSWVVVLDRHARFS
jgi:hypothetical protein